MYLGIDIGGTKTRVACLSDDGVIEDVTDFPTDQDFSVFVPNLIEVVKTSLADRAPATIGVGAPGTISRTEGKIISCGNLAWESADLKTPLVEAFSVPVVIDNDANVGAIGESAMGAGKDFDSVLYVTLSTGIGTGVTYQNQVPEVLVNCEGGQTLVNHDGELKIWEQIASGKAFTERNGAPGSDVEDPNVWNDYADLLAPGFYNLCRVIEPNVIIVGGGMGANFAKFEAHLTASFKSYFMPHRKPPAIVMAHDAENAVIYGCYVEAKRALPDAIPS